MHEPDRQWRDHVEVVATDYARNITFSAKE
jgi:hypothetical protein